MLALFPYTGNDASLRLSDPKLPKRFPTNNLYTGSVHAMMFSMLELSAVTKA